MYTLPLGAFTLAAPIATMAGSGSAEAQAVASHPVYTVFTERLTLSTLGQNSGPAQCTLSSCAFVDGQSPSLIAVPGGTVAGTQVADLPQEIRSSYWDGSGQQTDVYDAVAQVATHLAPNAPANTPTGTQYECVYGDPNGSCNGNAITYSPIHSGGQDPQGATVSYVVSPYGLKYARVVNGQDTFQLEACSFGDASGVEDSGKGITVTYEGVSLAETTTQNTGIGWTGVNGNNNGCQSSPATTTYGFLLPAGNTGSISAQASMSGCGTWSFHNGPSSMGGTPIDQYGDQEFSTWWDGTGQWNSFHGAEGSAGHMLYEFPMTHTTSQIAVSTYVQSCDNYVCG
ncbi:MAG: hypothetical protein ACYDAC_12540 [Candidatus Dormibacteria bacterium]